MTCFFEKLRADCRLCSEHNRSRDPQCRHDHACPSHDWSPPPRRRICTWTALQRKALSLAPAPGQSQRSDCARDNCIARPCSAFLRKERALRRGNDTTGRHVYIGDYICALRHVGSIHESVIYAYGLVTASVNHSLCGVSLKHAMAKAWCTSKCRVIS